MKNYYIFRFEAENESECEYLTEDRVTFSTDFSKALMMTEAEASDNCNEYSSDKYVAGCGSISK
jgi:hypothetical protein